MNTSIKLTVEEERVRVFLIKMIRSSSYQDYWTFYQDVSIKCNLNLDMANIIHRKKLSDILFKIFDFEFSNGRPLLTSVVYGKRSYKQGRGFFKGLQNHKIDGAHNKEIEELSKKENRRKYEREAVKFWKNDDNYKKYV